MAKAKTTNIIYFMFNKVELLNTNTNTNGQMDIAANPAVDPETIIGEAPAADRAESAPKNEAATEREEA